MRALPRGLGPEEIRRHQAACYAMITHVDAQIGRVLETLKKTGHADDTIIVFSADNGLAVARHGLLGRQNLYEHSVHVPLVFGGPGITKSRKRDAFCGLLDIHPTLCDLAGLDAPAGLEGQSLAPAMRGQGRKGRESLFFAYKDVQRAVRDERFKLIEYNVAGQRTTQLFDLEDDLWELKNLARDGRHAQRLQGLRSRLVWWKEKLDDPATSGKTTGHELIYTQADRRVGSSSKVACEQQHGLFVRVMAGRFQRSFWPWTKRTSAKNQRLRGCSVPRMSSRRSTEMIRKRPTASSPGLQGRTSLE